MNTSYRATPETLRALSDVVPVTGEARAWRALSERPRFLLPELAGLDGAWLRIDMRVSAPQQPARATVRFDLGEGFDAGLTVEMAGDAAGHFRFWLQVPAKVVAACLEPVRATGEFRIDSLSIRTSSPARAVLAALQSEWGLSPRATLRKLARAVLCSWAGGWTGARRSLLSSLDRNVPGYGFVPDHDAASEGEQGAGLAQLRRFAAEAFARERARPRSDEAFVARAAEAVDSFSLPVQAIAFYLPQFHPIPENDAWWGKGFTEWTNVANAVPQFLGHHQPQLPADLGFYDLRVPDVMRQQVELARRYGIAGFCFHYYWFGGRRLLEMPVNRFLADAELDLSFCYCWANENWTRRWDGLEDDVLMAQRYSPEDDFALIDELAASFRDPRYIRVDGRPMWIVYRATLLPDPVATTERWRCRARELGFAGLYLVAAKTFDVKDALALGFDASVEFPPHQARLPDVTRSVELINPGFRGSVHRYQDLVDAFTRFAPAPCPEFRTVVPGWDNEARRPAAGRCIVGNTPERYEEWVLAAAQATLRQRPGERFLFINAWNEWAEGAHLEPDRRYGHAFLRATARALQRAARSGQP